MLRTFLEENFPEKPLIIVSNREPYIHKKAGKGVRIEKPAGGVTSALDDVLKATGGTWVAWGSGTRDKQFVDDRNCVRVPPDSAAYTLKRVWLNPIVVENYYHGYSNHVLWPLCHITLDRVYITKRFWLDYVKANQSFASSVIEEIVEDSIVWIHDYHLCLLPAILREKRPDLTIAHFWHIPWPDWSVFRVCPQAKEIIEGLLGNDLIGFQIPLFAKNFMECIKEANINADIDYQNMNVVYRGQTTRLKAFPISIDYEKFSKGASSTRTLRMIKNIKEKYGLHEKYVGIGVDRLEYTKGLLKRLQAIDLLFERYKGLHDRFTFIQIAVPTRMKEPYITYKKAVDELIKKINKKYSTKDWKPIIYIDKKVEQRDLVAFYRMADLAIISSIYDGMNLVAKEFVASQIDEKGVLILSELAGAAEELDGAILVNPYDIEEFSRYIKMALTMDTEEKIARMRTLRRQVREKDIYKWIFDILREVSIISSTKYKKCRYLFDSLEEIEKRLGDEKVFLFLDYDGTLTPIVESPDRALLSPTIRSLLLKLKEIISISIISGRELKDIKKRVLIEDIILAGNHGAEIWDGKRIIKKQSTFKDYPALKDLLKKLEDGLSHIQGVIIEDKGITGSLHFRMVSAKYLGELFDIWKKIFKDYENIFRITFGKRVFEIRPIEAWNKGDAVVWILENKGKGYIPIYIGDDVTDEDAFRAIAGKGITISVGENPEAEFYVKDQSEVKGFLEWLIKKYS